MSYDEFPPLQVAASYNLEQVLQQVKKIKTGRATSRVRRA